MKIEIDIPNETAMLVTRMLMLANDTNNVLPNGTLTIASLIEMLLDDCALVVRRPGCWEAVNMSQILTSHGYEI